MKGKMAFALVAVVAIVAVVVVGFSTVFSVWPPATANVYCVTNDIGGSVAITSPAGLFAGYKPNGGGLNVNTVASGTEVTFKATSYQGYEFTVWQDTFGRQYRTPTVSITVQGDQTIDGYFGMIAYFSASGQSSPTPHPTATPTPAPTLPPSTPTASPEWTWTTPTPAPTQTPHSNPAPWDPYGGILGWIIHLFGLLPP